MSIWLFSVCCVQVYSGGRGLGEIRKLPGTTEDGERSKDDIKNSQKWKKTFKCPYLFAVVCYFPC